MSPEYDSSWEHLTSSERRTKIASHIATMGLGRRILQERYVQQEAVQDFEARSYQLDAFNALWSARKEGADRGLIHLATGLGKTSVAVVDYAAFRLEAIEQTGQAPRALFVVHQNNILEQASERFDELLPDASRSFYLNQHKKLPHSEVTFASFQALTRSADRFPSDYFDYIIYDEAHHIEAATYKKVVDHFSPKFQLGLTATPERMDEKDIENHFGKALYTKTLGEAIAENHLAKVNYNIMFDDAVSEAIQSGFEASSLAEIQRLFDVYPRNEVIIEKIHEAQERIREEQGVEQVKTIIFCADLEHADSIADMMGGESYHSGRSDHAQKALLEAFRKDGLETITVRDMFNEGIDIPDARLIVFLRTTQSPAVFEQQLGRGLRKNKDKQEVTVLDFVANIERISMIRELESEIDAVNGRRSPRASRAKNEDNDDTEADVAAVVDTIRSHKNYGEFIFSQEVIDLLEKYNIASSPAPDGWVSYSEAADLLGVSDDAVRARLGVLNLSGQYFKGRRGTPTQYISPEAFVSLKEYATGIAEGYISVIEVADMLSITQTTAFNRISKLGIASKVFIQNNGVAISAILERDAEVMELYGRVPEGLLSFGEVSELLGWEWGTVKKRAEELQLEVQKHVVDKTGQTSSFLSVEDVERLELYGQIPNGFITIRDIALELGVSVPVIRTRINHLEIETTKFSSLNRGIAPDYISSKDAERLRVYSTAESGDFVNARDVARQLGMPFYVLGNVLKELNIEMKEYPGGNGRPVAYVPADTVDIIRANRRSDSIGELYSYEKLADEFEVSEQTIVAWVKKAGIVAQKIQVNRGGRPSSFITAEQVESIRAIVAPKGYMRLAEAATQLGIGKNTLVVKIGQLGIRTGRYAGAQGPDAEYISPEDLSKVEGEYIIPEGWISLLDVAKRHGVTMGKLKKELERNGISAKIVSSRGKGRPVPYVSPGDLYSLNL